MSSLRSFDAFAKPVEGLKTKSAVGGVITIIAGAIATTLFLSQVVLYFGLETRQHFQLAESYTSDRLPILPEHADSIKIKPARILQHQREKDPNNIKLFIHVTFPYVACKDLALSMDGANGATLDKIHGVDAITRRPPTVSERATIREAFQDEESKKISLNKACTYHGHVFVPRVGGSFAITLTSESWSTTHSILELFFTGAVNHRAGQEAHNVTHFIHNINFGTPFVRMDHPLQNVPTIFHFPVEEKGGQFEKKITEERSGIGLSSVTVKLVHTKYKRFARSTKEMYQMSVTQHTVTATTLAQRYSSFLPGMNVLYDFTPFSVHHSETRENIFLFLGSLVSIVSGVFVTVGLLSSCLLSAVNVGKKID